MSKIKIAIVGIGNCASSLIQGLKYYENKKDNGESIPGLMHNSLGKYRISDIKLVAAIDVDKRKVGKDISEAIFQPPNCTKVFCEIPKTGVIVNKGPVLDGVAEHMKDDFQVDDNQKPIDIISLLEESGTEILVNYLPVGSQVATEFYAQTAIDAGCSFINCIPVFIASDTKWADKFKQANLPIIGDDAKSQLGATEIHRILTQTIIDRGARIDSTYQLNVGGNTDFKNMLDPSRLVSKRISKTESISSIINDKNTYVYAGPSGCVDCLKDNKICNLRIDFRIFGDVPCSLDLKLSVEDSPNSAGSIIDAIRLAKIALDRGIGGPLISSCAYYMKHPPEQMRDEDARRQLEDFTMGE